MLSIVMVMGLTLSLSGQNITEVLSTTGMNQGSSSQVVQNRVYTIDRPVRGLGNILAYLEKETGLTFVYRQELVAPYSDMSLQEDSRNTLEGFLNDLLEGTPLSYTVSRDYIVLTDKRSLRAALQDTVIKGEVRDAASNETMPGVNIKVKGTPRGVSTGKEGKYELVVPTLRDTLLFSFIGYKNKEVPINGRTLLNVTLEQETSELSEVVVTGVVNREAQSFTGSHVTISNEELKRAGGNDNLFKSLQNIDPAFVVFEDLAQGSNPNSLPEMQLRGTSTFPAEETGLSSELKGNYLKSPNQPLFILDGFETTAEDVFDLDVNRVESITILKDASAKALYGSKAANGVVVIETKQLYATDPIITYNANMFVEAPDLSSYNLTNALEKLEAERIDGVYEDDDPQDYIALQQTYNARLKRAREGLNTDWMSKPLRNAVGQDHSISVELGTEDLKLLGGVSFGDDQGVMKGSYRRNLSGNIKASYRVDNFLLRNNLQVNKKSTRNSPYGEFAEYSRMNPYWTAENPDGSIPYYAEVGVYQNTSGAVSSNVRFTNPLYNSTLDSKNSSSYLNFKNNFYLEWHILPELRTTARVSVSTWDNEADEFYPAEHTMFERGVYLDQPERKGLYQLNSGERNSLSGDLNMTYTNEIGKHFYMGNAGFKISEENYSELIHTVEGFPSERLNDPIFGRSYALDSNPDGVEGINREVSLLGIGSYMYDERYMADLTLRSSASSQFGADKRWAGLWSFGLGWNLHNESFLKDQQVVDRLKLRGSVGSTGNQNFRTNESISTYSYYLQSFYDGFVGSYTQNMANPGLQWESKFDYNAGIDADLANLSLRFDYYESYTENLVTDLTIPSSTGFTTVKENVGRIKNSGIEVKASYLLVSRSEGFLSLNVGVATNKNEIIDLSEAMSNHNERLEEQAANRSNSEPVLKYEDGRSMNDIWAVPSMGIDPATGNEIYVKRDGSTTYEYDPGDMVAVGNSEPDYRGNFGVNGEYKGFGLSVIARFKGGGQMYNQTLVNKVENVDIRYNVDRRVLTGRWKEPGDQAQFKRLGLYYQDDPDGDNSNTDFRRRTRPTSRFVQDLNQLDIAAISLYYHFSPRLLEPIGVRRLRIGANMNDVATISSVRIERGRQYPFARRVSFSLSATF